MPLKCVPKHTDHIHVGGEEGGWVVGVVFFIVELCVAYVIQYW